MHKHKSGLVIRHKYKDTTQVDTADIITARGSSVHHRWGSQSWTGRSLAPLQHAPGWLWRGWHQWVALFLADRVILNSYDARMGF